MLEIKHLTKHYDRDVLKDLSVKFPDKGLCVILGKSGCGKTTLLNILGGIDQDYEGSVTYQGENIRDIKQYLKKHVAFVFQNFYLINEMNVKENVLLPSYFRRIIKNKTNKELERLHLKEYKNYNVKKLSGGQKQRVAIIRSIISDVDIVLCDEPTGSLDKKNSHQIFKTLYEMAQDRLIIVITHDEVLAKKYHDYLYCLENGQITCLNQTNRHFNVKRYQTTTSSFFKLILKYFYINKNNYILTSQVLFIAILSLLVTFSLTQSTRHHIHQQVESMIPSSTIVIKRKDHKPITLSQLKQMKDSSVQYRYLENDHVEILGLSLHNIYSENQTLYIQDYYQSSQLIKKGREIKEDNEIVVSQNTYQQLCKLFNKKNLLNHPIYLYFQKEFNIEKKKMIIVGISQKNTLFETVYFKEFALNMYENELFQSNEGLKAFLQVKGRNDIKGLRKKYTQYDFKIANQDFHSSVDERMTQFEILFLCFGILTIVSACLLLGEILYLMVVRRQRIFAIMKSFGATSHQIFILIILQGVLLCSVSYIEARGVMYLLSDFVNKLLSSMLLNENTEFIIQNQQISIIIYFIMIILSIICGLIPARRANQSNIIDLLK